jgi:hypothetical protein
MGLNEHIKSVHLRIFTFPPSKTASTNINSSSHFLSEIEEKGLLLTETYVFYASTTLFAMGIAALVMSLLFRQRCRTLNSLPKDLSATVFSQTFVIFDPHPAQKKVIHRFLGLLPFVGLVTSLAAIMAVWTMLTDGLLIILFIFIIGLNMIVIEEAPEVYRAAQAFIKAVQKNSDFAKGDLKVLRVVQRLAPKICNYYLGLAAFFVTASVALPYLWEAMPSFATWAGNSLTLIGGLNGQVFQLVTILFLLNIGILQFVAFKVKSRIFRYEIR